MLIGSHFLLYSKAAEADRGSFRDVLGFQCVDAGEDWLILATSPAEAGVDPSDGGQFSERHPGHELPGAVLGLMGDELKAQIAPRKAKKVPCSEIETAPWGQATTIWLASGGRIGVYQPQHPTVLNLKSK